jgi:glycerophosphoryl diester phosphodiesterase
MSLRTLEVVCHKGANQIAPENTFAAAQRCVDWGVDYVEIDVWTSRDGHCYLMHDGAVDRTTDGSGHLLALTSEEIGRLDAGSWFDLRFASERVPRLDEYLRWIRGKARVFVDVKFAHPQHLIDLLHETGMADQCFLWSGSNQLMRLFHTLDPSIALKVNVSSAAEALEAQAELGAAIVEIGPEALGDELVDTCHDHGIRVMVNYMGADASRLRDILQWDIDMINTDNGDLCLVMAEEMGRRVS